MSLVRYGRAIAFASTADDLIKFIQRFEMKFYRGLSERSRPKLRPGRLRDAERCIAALKEVP